MMSMNLKQGVILQKDKTACVEVRNNIKKTESYLHGRMWKRCLLAKYASSLIYRNEQVQAGENPRTQYTSSLSFVPRQQEDTRLENSVVSEQ